MKRFITGLSLMLASFAACSGCGESGPERVPTYPVVGRVLVDGEPVEMLAVRSIGVSAADKEHPTESQCFTAADGSFKIGTYEARDGVPEGDYVLTFQWGDWNLFSHAYEGDKFNGRYIDPATSTIKFTVTKGKPVDLGEIALTAK